MLDSKEKIVLVFNGEIYNFKELKIELIKEGFIFKGNSDSEVLLNLYISKGIKMLSQLNGIFSFAIWDIKDKSLFKKELLLTIIYLIQYVPGVKELELPTNSSPPIRDKISYAFSIFFFIN